MPRQHPCCVSKRVNFGSGKSCNLGLAESHPPNRRGKIGAESLGRLVLQRTLGVKKFYCQTMTLFLMMTSTAVVVDVLGQKVRGVNRVDLLVFTSGSIS